MAPKKGPMRILCDQWMFSHPYCLTHDCFAVFAPGIGMTRTPIYQEYLDFVRTRLINGNGTRVYEEEDTTFMRKIYNATMEIRKPFGIVRDWITHRDVGDPPAACWQVLKEKYLGNSPQARELRRKSLEAVRKYNDSDHGWVMRSLYNDNRRENRRKRRIESLSQHPVAVYGNRTALDVGQQIVDKSLDDLYGLTPRQWGDEFGGVYPFYTEKQGKDAIKLESTRFITDGQQEKRKNGKTYHHNAILMWNPRGVQFPDNICPYNERFDHGLEAIIAIECEMLGIFHVVVVDEEISEHDGRQIEKGIQQVLEEWPIPKRLFRVSGAGKGDQSKVLDGKRRVVGITFLPPDFFANNPNISVVASAH